MAWNDKQTMQIHLKEVTMGSNLKRKEYGTVMLSGANKDGLELLVKISWRTAFDKYFDETLRTPSSVTALYS